RSPMSPNTSDRVKVESVLVATDFTPASKMAMLYAMSIARRHRSKLLITHVVNSQSESAIMDGWRAGQSEVTDHFVGGRLDGIDHELLVKSGGVWPVLAQLISERGVNLVVVGTRGRTGVRKFILGSVAEDIFRQSSCPVLTVGPNLVGQDPDLAPQRILTPTGFARHSLVAVKFALLLAQDLRSSIALMHVVTDPAASGANKEQARQEREARLQTLIPEDAQLASPPTFFVEFGSAAEKIVSTAMEWNANLIMLGLRHVEEESRGESTWARAYEIVRQASCPVLTIRLPE